MHFNSHLSATEEHLIQDVKVFFLAAEADTGTELRKIVQDQKKALISLGYKLGRTKKRRSWELLWSDLGNDEIPLSQFPKTPGSSAILFEAEHSSSVS